MSEAKLSQRVVAEMLGTTLLLATVVGSGIMGERLAGGNVAIALLANAIATGAMLYVLISTFGPISGAHFNPLVSALSWFEGTLKSKDAAYYIAGQVVSAWAGVLVAHLMFELPVTQYSQHIRTGLAQFLSEVVATFGLLTILLQMGKRSGAPIAAVVGCYITAAYWFTASTSFANPAVTLARAFTDTFAGIRLIDVPAFMIAQCGGALLAYIAYRHNVESK